MAKTVIVKPAQGLVIRDPATMQALPEEGLPVELSPHWLRRRAAGDVTFEDPKAAAAAKTAQPAAKQAKE